MRKILYDIKRNTTHKNKISKYPSGTLEELNTLFYSIYLNDYFTSTRV